MGAPTPPPAASVASASVRLELAGQPASQDSVVVVQTGMRIGGALYQTTAQSVFRKTLQQATPNGWVVEVTTLDFTQEARTDLEELTGYLVRIKERLLVEVDRAGQLRRILNKEEVQAKWEALRPSLKAKYRASAEVTPVLLDQMATILREEGHLENVLRQAPEYQLLFPPVFDRLYHTDTSERGRAEVKQFLGALDLPIVTEARLAEPPGAAGTCTVLVAGWVDGEHYPAADVRQAVRAITDRFDVDPTLHLLYRENYVLGPAPYLGVTHAARHVRYEVPGVVGREVTAVLSTLTD